MQGLTQRQQMVLNFIRQSITDRGYPPTLREIGARMGIRSTNGVNDHLRALERKGYLTREDMKSRALRPTSLVPEGRERDAEGDGGADAAEGTDLAVGLEESPVSERSAEDGPRETGRGSGREGGPGIARSTPLADGGNRDWTEIVVLGRVAAGMPLFADEQVMDTMRLDPTMIRGGGDVFGLRVQGDSMIDAGILNGDTVFVRRQATAQRGQIVVALIGDEATVKYYFPEKDYVRFQPANKEMAPILVRASDFRPTMLLGVVVGVFRRV